MDPWVMLETAGALRGAQKQCGGFSPTNPVAVCMALVGGGQMPPEELAVWNLLLGGIRAQPRERPLTPSAAWSWCWAFV